MKSSQIEPPLVIVVGGIDPAGGAGLLRDAATVTARGGRPHAIGTAWTEQADGLHRVEPRDPAALRDALGRAVDELRPAAVKVGMAVGPDTAGALLAGLARFDGPVVIDPVLATSRGGPLWAGSARALLPLLRRATVATPNAVEAAALSGLPVASLEEAEAAGRRLVAEDGLGAVLVKGGHLVAASAPRRDQLTDLLIGPAGTDRFVHPRTPGPSPRGTGCALASALAVELGRGQPLPAAAAIAIRWLSDAIAGAVVVGGERHLASGDDRSAKGPR